MYIIIYVSTCTLSLHYFHLMYLNALESVFACKFHTMGWSVCRRGAVRLGMSKLTQVDFVPKEMVSYSKETQTPTEAVSHTDQKAGISHEGTRLLPLLNLN